MNIHHLELFYYVARHGGITEAVRNIPYGIQQPAVSGQVVAPDLPEPGLVGECLFHRLGHRAVSLFDREVISRRAIPGRIDRDGIGHNFVTVVLHFIHNGRGGRLVPAIRWVIS